MYYIHDPKAFSNFTKTYSFKMDHLFLGFFSVCSILQQLLLSLTENSACFSPKLKSGVEVSLTGNFYIRLGIMRPVIDVALQT